MLRSCLLFIVFFFFFLLPSLSSLFPYTTLFRSRNGADGVFAEMLRDLQDQTLVMVPGFKRIHDRRQVAFELHVDHRDRKSTRLNSSHVAISYAVFCLKKKTLCSEYSRIIELTT